MTWYFPSDSVSTFHLIDLNGMIFGLNSLGIIWRWLDGKWNSFASRINDDMTAIGNTLFGSRWGQIFISTDSGATWKNTYNLPEQYLEPVYSFGDTLFTLINVGNPGWPVYFSTDQGMNWNKAGIMPTDGGFFYFRTGTTSDEVAVYNLYHINISQDHGFHWKTIGDEFTHFIKNHDNVLLLGLEDTAMDRSGLFKLIGSKLIQILPDTEVSTINGFAADDQFAYIATAHKGIWRTPLSNLPLSSVQISIAPKEITLYPNPSRGKVILPAGTQLSLVKVYDELGILRQSIPQVQLSGEIIFNEQLTNGVYTLLLDSKDGKNIARVVIDK